MLKSEKIAKVNDYTKKIQESKGIIVIEFQKIPTGQLNSLKKQLKAISKNGMKFEVIKNKLFKIAIQQLGLKNLVSLFVGPKAVVFENYDLAETIKILYNFSKENPNFKIVSAYYDEKLFSLQDIKQLVTLPSKEELIGKLYLCLRSPIERIILALRAPLENFVNCLEDLRRKKS